MAINDVNQWAEQIVQSWIPKNNMKYASDGRKNLIDSFVQWLSHTFEPILQDIGQVGNIQQMYRNLLQTSAAGYMNSIIDKTGNLKGLLYNEDILSDPDNTISKIVTQLREIVIDIKRNNEINLHKFRSFLTFISYPVHGVYAIAAIPVLSKLSKSIPQLSYEIDNTIKNIVQNANGQLEAIETQLLLELGNVNENVKKIIDFIIDEIKTRISEYGDFASTTAPSETVEETIEEPEAEPATELIDPPDFPVTEGLSIEEAKELVRKEEELERQRKIDEKNKKIPKNIATEPIIEPESVPAAITEPSASIGPGEPTIAPEAPVEAPMAPIEAPEVPMAPVEAPVAAPVQYPSNFTYLITLAPELIDQMSPNNIDIFLRQLGGEWESTGFHGLLTLNMFYRYSIAKNMGVELDSSYLSDAMKNAMIEIGRLDDANVPTGKNIKYNAEDILIWFDKLYRSIEKYYNELDIENESYGREEEKLDTENEQNKYWSLIQKVYDLINDRVKIGEYTDQFVNNNSYSSIEDNSQAMLDNAISIFINSKYIIDIISKFQHSEEIESMKHVIQYIQNLTAYSVGATLYILSDLSDENDQIHDRDSAVLSLRNSNHILENINEFIEEIMESIEKNRGLSLGMRPEDYEYLNAQLDQLENSFSRNIQSINPTVPSRNL